MSKYVSILALDLSFFKLYFLFWIFDQTSYDIKVRCGVLVTLVYVRVPEIDQSLALVALIVFELQLDFLIYISHTPFVELLTLNLYRWRLLVSELCLYLGQGLSQDGLVYFLCLLARYVVKRYLCWFLGLFSWVANRGYLSFDLLQGLFGSLVVTLSSIIVVAPHTASLLE